MEIEFNLLEFIGFLTLLFLFCYGSHLALRSINKFHDYLKGIELESAMNKNRIKRLEKTAVDLSGRIADIKKEETNDN